MEKQVSSVAGHKISHIFMDSEGMHKIRPTQPVLCQMNPFQILTSYLLK
jgi:hypothetical protein